MNSPEPILPEPSQASAMPMPLSARLMNVIAAPSEVFDHVKTAAFTASNWVVPALLLVVISWVFSYLILRQPAIQHQIREMAVTAIEQRIAEGKVPESQAEQIRTVTERWAILGAKIGAAASPPFIAIITPFGWGLIVWLVGTRVFKAQFGFMKAVEVSGLCMILSTLDAVIRSLLVLVTGNLWAATSPTLLMTGFDPQNPLHAGLALLNVMTFWVLALRTLGLARLSDVSFWKASVWIFGLWLGYHALAIGGSAAVRALF